MITAVALGMYVFGTMITSVGATAYHFNAYPKESGEVGAWINLSGTVGDFHSRLFPGHVVSED